MISPSVRVPRPPAPILTVTLAVMRSCSRALPVLAMAFSLAAGRVEAHHEAIYGSQSSLAISADRYASLQVFSKQTGPRGDRTQETTTVFGAGFAPRRGPLSISFVLPFSVINGGGTVGGGIENAVVAARYRLRLPAVDRAFGVESYALAIGGVELPTGTVDYEFGDGPAALVAGGTLGVERRPFSALAYTVIHRYAERRNARDSGNTFVGGGIAWTPIDDESAGRLLSVQLGLAHERTWRAEMSGIPLDDTGGWALMAHPTVVFATGQRTLMFVSVSAPLAHDWRDPIERERFRVGAGTVIRFGR
jgi:hypothetical protein